MLSKDAVFGAPSIRQGLPLPSFLLLFLSLAPAFADAPSFLTTPAYSPGQPYIFETPLIVGDFNRDGHLDVAVQEETPSGEYYIQVYLGNGHGAFTALPPQLMFTTPTGGGYAYFSEAADFNGDGKLDLLLLTDVTSYPDETLTVQFLAGNGDGTFIPGTALSLPNTANSYAYSVGIADLNGDGILDIVIPEEQSADANIATYFGKGDGTFTAGPITNILEYNFFVTLKDMNLDGHPDLVYSAGLQVYYAPGNALGSFNVADQVLMGQIPSGYSDPDIKSSI